MAALLGMVWGACAFWFSFLVQPDDRPYVHRGLVALLGLVTFWLILITAVVVVT